MKQQRRSLSPDFISTASQIITDRIMEHIHPDDCIMLYLSAFKEPDTFMLLDILHSRNIRTVVPVSDTDSLTITLSLITSVSELNKGAYGISEPKKVMPVSVSDINTAIIPGIAFSENGDRLGFGKGYYDRFLAEFKGLKIGICYDFQVLPEIPTSPHDVKMDLIITETRIYNDF